MVTIQGYVLKSLLSLIEHAFYFMNLYKATSNSYLIGLPYILLKWGLLWIKLFSQQSNVSFLQKL